MKHTHDDDRLTFGCQACIGRVELDQLSASLADKTDDELTAMWARSDLDPRGDALLGRLLIERCILSIEEVEACGVEVA